jgi:hypothetical protein
MEDLYEINEEALNSFLAEALLIIEGKRQNIEKKYTSSVGEEGIQKILDADERNQYKHAGWMAKQAKQGENVDQIIASVKSFKKNKQRLKKKDINAYKSVDDLNSAIDSLGLSNREKRKQILDTGAEFLGKFGDWVLYLPLTEEGSCELGRSTTWCTAYTDPQKQNLFYDYILSEKIIFYYIIKKGSDPIKNPESKLSVGFLSGNPILKGQNGGLSVDADNNGLDEDILKEILGDQYRPIMDKMEEKTNELGGKHPEVEKRRKEIIDTQTERLGTFGDWDLYLPLERDGSNALGTGTTWSTAEIGEGNKFYNYIDPLYKDKNIILYYVIKKESNTKDNPESKLMISFVNGSPNLSGKSDSLSVDSANNGLTEEDLKKILGSEYESIMDKMTEKTNELGGMHPFRSKRLERRKEILDIGTERLGTFGDWDLYLPLDGSASYELGRHTKWIPSNEESNISFERYVDTQEDKGNYNRILYYIIKKSSDPRKNPESKIIINFEGRSQRFANANGARLTEEELRKILGSEYESIMNKIIEKTNELGGMHPIRNERLLPRYNKIVQKVNNGDYNQDNVTFSASFGQGSSSPELKISFNTSVPSVSFTAKNIRNLLQNGITSSEGQQFSGDEFGEMLASRFEKILNLKDDTYTNYKTGESVGISGDKLDKLKQNFNKNSGNYKDPISYSVEYNNDNQSFSFYLNETKDFYGNEVEYIIQFINEALHRYNKDYNEWIDMNGLRSLVPEALDSNVSLDDIVNQQQYRNIDVKFDQRNERLIFSTSFKVNFPEDFINAYWPPELRVADYRGNSRLREDEDGFEAEDKIIELKDQMPNFIKSETAKILNAFYAEAQALNNKNKPDRKTYSTPQIQIESSPYLSGLEGDLMRVPSDLSTESKISLEMYNTFSTEEKENILNFLKIVDQMYDEITKLLNTEAANFRPNESLQEEEQLDEKSSKRAKRKRRAKRKKKKAKRDACYHKVRARYDVWPSAYASGALVKCRKVGAANWGNKSKKKNESIQNDKLRKMIEEELRIVIRSRKKDDKIPGGLAADIPGSMEDKHQTIADMHDVSKDKIDAEVHKGVEAEMEHTDDEEIAHEIAMDHVYEDPEYYTKLDTIEEESIYKIFQEELAAVLDEKKKKRKSKKKKKKKKAGTESGKESNLGDWFGRKGAPGKKGGWVDCNTCSLLVGQLPVLVKKGAEASHGAKNQPKERNNGSKTNHQRRI